MHDRLFANQNEWGESGKPNEVFVGYADEMGLDVDAFRACLQNREPLDEIRGDFQDGVDGGVRGTPAFFLGGEMLSGAQPFSAFRQRIESLLDADEDDQSP
jgi:predicted DsbA family dithiol-disulfide isomerase